MVGIRDLSSLKPTSTENFGLIRYNVLFWAWNRLICPYFYCSFTCHLNFNTIELDVNDVQSNWRSLNISRKFINLSHNQKNFRSSICIQVNLIKSLKMDWHVTCDIKWIWVFDIKPCSKSRKYDKLLNLNESKDVLTDAWNRIILLKVFRKKLKFSCENWLRFMFFAFETNPFGCPNFNAFHIFYTHVTQIFFYKHQTNFSRPDCNISTVVEIEQNKRRSKHSAHIFKYYLFRLVLNFDVLTACHIKNDEYNYSDVAKHKRSKLTTMFFCAFSQWWLWHGMPSFNRFLSFHLVYFWELEKNSLFLSN